MKQVLIVEGNDAIVLATICQLRQLPPPKGYSRPEKFKTEFVHVAGGISNINAALGQLLADTSITNIGIIVDANDEGPQKRWETIKSQLAHVFPSKILASISLSGNGIVIEEQELPSVGVWIMPDNLSNGYLEHFLGNLIADDDSNLAFAEKTIGDLMGQVYCQFSISKQQKAVLHTWLAWQKEPGKSLGAAVKAGYFNIHAPIVQPFLTWFSKTFVLEKY